MTNTRILYLTKKAGISKGYQQKIKIIAKNIGLQPSDLLFINPHNKMGNWNDYVEFKNKKPQILPGYIKQARGIIQSYVNALKPAIIICECNIFLDAILRKPGSKINSHRGSVYFFNDLPVVITEKIEYTNDVKHGTWLFMHDIQKATRWIRGEQKTQPVFDYKVCHTLEDINELHKRACSPGIVKFIAEDIETLQGFITSIQFTFQYKEKLLTYVVPFLNPLKPGNAHWETKEDEVQVWITIQRINKNNAIKIFQNGSYDNAYLIKYRVPTVNYFIDTYHLMHAIYCEAPKALHFISSLLLDYMHYWKDELKGSKEDIFPKTKEQLEQYWRYGAQDTYYTYCCARIIINLISKIPWAMFNYNIRFSLQVGPYMAMDMRGLKRNQDRLNNQKTEAKQKADKALSDIRKMTKEKEFNPKSADHVSQLIYNVLGAHEVNIGKGKGKTSHKTVDESVLKIIRTQHVLFDIIIKTIWDYKKPEANVSKYYDKFYLNGRFYYHINASGTETGRASGKQHQFWVGTNPQNVPLSIRDIFVADDGMMFVEPDYSQSDAVFTAYESQDLKYIENVSSDKDTHILHAEHFFGIEYDKIVEEMKKGNPVYSDKTTGIRALTKRIVHGANYIMQKLTMWFHLVKEDQYAVINAAKHLGIKVETFDEQIKFVDKYLLGGYHQMYTGLNPWYDRINRLCVKQGNKLQTSFGTTRLFFGDPLKDKSVQREIAANYGQGDTAENINRTILAIYYKHNEFDNQLELMTQTHDSILFQVPTGRFDLIRKVLTIMEEPVTIHGREVSVPTECAIGFSWGKGLKEWNRVSEEMGEFVNHEMELEMGYKKKELEAAE